MKNFVALLLLTLLTAGFVGPVEASVSPVGQALVVETSPAPLVPALGQFVRSGLAQTEDAEAPIESVEAPSAAPRRWWPVVMSAAVPGLGELVTGHWIRGTPMIALDAWMISALLDHRQKGRDLEDEYRAFADQHYSESEWELALAQGDLEDYFPDLPVGSGPEDVDLYVTREDDEREWYENIGKWDQFAWGWEEYFQDDFDPGPANNPNFMTPMRQKYVNLREDSNSEFGKANGFGGVSLVLRIISIIDTAYLEGFVGGRYLSRGPGLDDPGQVRLTSDVKRDHSRIGLSVTY